MDTIKNRGLKIFLLLFPALLFYIVYVVLPGLSNVVLSLFYYDGVKSIRFAGLKNWMELFGDIDFLIASKNSLIIFVGIFGIMIPLAFFMAVLLNNKLKFVDAFKFIYFAPIVVSSIMIGLIWGFILDPTLGLLNNFLRSVGLESFALDWIGGTTFSPYSITFICIWQWMGINMMIFLTGIKNIPKQIFESAAIDGSGGLRTAVRITLPLIKEQLLASAILNVVGVLKVYDLVVALTGGGPGYSSDVMASYMMRKMFDEMQFGYGATIAVIISIICIILSVIMIKINKKETYQF